MFSEIYEREVLVDTSAVIALHDPKENKNSVAVEALASISDHNLSALNVTSHESYTRARYDLSYRAASEVYDFLRNQKVNVLCFDKADEIEAKRILDKYEDHDLSFHDALCASVMKRVGIFKIFTFDKHFQIMGFEVIPALYKYE